MNNIQNNNNMKRGDKDDFMLTLTKLTDKTIYDDNPNEQNNYILTENEFTKNKSIKLKKTEFKLSPNSYGKYLSEYIDNVNNTNDELLFLDNNNENFFAADIYYSKNASATFTFITGPAKIGKTFLILHYIRYGYFYIYFNFKKLNELEENKKYEEIKNMIFYEIAGYFFTYNDYQNFCHNFINKNEYINQDSFDFKQVILNLIESFEILLNDNNDYEKMMIIFDEFELDQLD